MLKVKLRMVKLQTVKLQMEKSQTVKLQMALLAEKAAVASAAEAAVKTSSTAVL